MAKKIAVLAVNPVNGSGLFQYLETFFENSIPFTTFAVADSPQIKTNSGINLQTDDIVSNLKNKTGDYDALVFACGDAMPKFGENANKSYNQDLLAVVKNFHVAGKLLIGHCAFALLLDTVGKGERVALHPFIKSMPQNCVGTDEKAVVANNFYTAQTENTIVDLLPDLIKVLK